MSNILGDNITKLRNKRGISQEQLGDIVGVSRQTVSLWELGTVVPKASRIVKICEALHAAPEELFNSSSDDSLENTNLVIEMDDIKKKIKTVKASESQNSELSNNIYNDLTKQYNIGKENDAEQDPANSMKSNKILTKKDDEKPQTIPVARNINKSKKLRKIVTKFLIVLLVIYLIYSSYKFIVLTYVTSRIQKYKNLDNYYCKITDYGDENLNSELKVWYKDGIYKIIRTVLENKEVKSYTSWIDTNTYTRYELNDQDNSIIVNNLSKDNSFLLDNYLNGKYLYSNFPDYIKNEKMNIFLLSIQFNKIYLQINKNTVNYYFNEFNVQFENNTFLPIMESKSVIPNENSGIQGVKYYEIKLNAVKDSDINVVRN